MTLITATILATTISSCKKETIQKSNKPSVQQIADSFSVFRTLDQSESEMLSYPEDENYEKIDMALYALGNILKDNLTSSMITTLIPIAKAAPDKMVSFTQIFETFPNLKSTIDGELANQTIDAIPYDFSSFDLIQAVMERNNINYDLGIYFYNLSTYTTSSSFILTPGLELDDETGFDDQIMAWNKTSTSITPIKISETEAIANTSLFLTLDLIQLGDNQIPIEPGGTTPIDPVGPRYTKIKLKSINPHYRFEKRGKSEIYIQAVVGNWNSWSGLYSSLFPVNDYSMLLIKTKDMNVWHNVDKTIAEAYSQSVVWNIYERDWFHVPKLVNTVLTSNPQYNTAPMKFGDDVYAIMPSINKDDANINPHYMGPLRTAILNNGANLTYMNGWNGYGEMKFYAN